MKEKALYALLIAALITLTLPMLGKVEFRQIKQWNHGNKELYEVLYCTVITNDGNVVIRPGAKKESVLITPEETVFFAPMGQGPSDIYLPISACNYSEGIAYLEFQKKIKIFSKKNNTYTWKETIWLKGQFAPMGRDILFYNGKWFIAGSNAQAYDSRKKIRTDFLLEVFNNKGEIVKGFFHIQYKDKVDNGSKDYFLALNQSHIFFMIENELKTVEIDADELKILREIDLEIPEFYKKMPGDFYILKEYHMDTNRFMKDTELWKIAYSSITNIDTCDAFLVVQVRTCSDKMQKYAVLFYDVNTLKLKKTFFTGDFFIGAKNGFYYFYANGNPGYDEEADKCIINLYSFVEGK